MSLQTDSESIAKARASMVWQQQIAAWEARLAGAEGDGMARYDAARELGAARSLPCLPGREVAELPIKDLLARVEADTVRSTGSDRMDAIAMLGEVEVPTVTISQALEN